MFNIAIFITFVVQQFNMKRQRFLKYFVVLALFITAGCSMSPDELLSADKLMESRPDSALHILKKIHNTHFFSPSNKAFYALLLSKAYDKNDSLIVSDSLINIATGYYDEKQPELAGNAWLYKARCARNRGNGVEQARALLTAQHYALKSNDNKLKGLIYCDKADMYQSQKQLDSAIILNKEGLECFKKAGDKRNVCLTAYSLGSIYNDNHLVQDSAKHYLFYALKLTGHIKDSIITNTIYKSIGLLEYHNKNYPSAIKYCKLAPKTNIPIYDENKTCIIAYSFFRMGRVDSALFYLRRIQDHDVIAKDYYSLWQMVYETTGNYKAALAYAKKLDEAKDSISSKKLQESFAGIERKFNYEKLSAENQNLVVKNKQRGITLLLILLAISVITIIVLFWRARIKRREYEILQELNNVEKVLLQQANENNELLQKQNKMQQLLLGTIEEYKSHTRKGKFKQPDVNSEQFRDEIITHIDSTYNNISQRLQDTYPLLTSNDILICVLLLAEFDSGMIAGVLGIKLDSVNTQRSRLRKRLNLDNTTNLYDFLANF